MSTVIDDKKGIFIFMFLNKTQYFVIELAMRVLGWNEEFVCCEAV
jgi:hypothetical protein